jgi:DUF1365 family protein
VLPAAKSKPTDDVMQFDFAKQFHVSPFWPMDMRYQWRLTTPNERLLVHMKNLRDGRRAFDATLTMERHEICSASLASALVRFPLMTAKVVTAIHLQALRLWLRRTPFFPHPALAHATPTGDDVRVSAPPHNVSAD